MEKFVNFDEAYGKKKFSYDLKQYVVTVEDLKRCNKAEVASVDETTAMKDKIAKLEDMLKRQFNRCAVQASQSGCVMCGFCGMYEECDQYRTVFQKKE